MGSHPLTDFPSLPPQKTTLSIEKMPSPSPSPINLIKKIISSSYGEGGLMSAALLALLFVILFIVFLQVYAKCFLTQSSPPPRRTVRTEVFSSASRVLGPTRFRRFFDDDDNVNCPAAAKGLDSSVIAKIPLFVYEELSAELECVICLSVFEDGEFGRKLGKCGHGFHVECIDMWLGSHSNCPTCRAPAAGGTKEGEVDKGLSNVGGGGGSGDDEVSVVEVVVENSGNEREEVGGVGGGDSSSSVWTAAAMGGSLKRMLSRSRSERKNCTLSNVVVIELEERERSSGGLPPV